MFTIMSSTQRKFIIDNLNDNIRFENRPIDSYRNIQIKKLSENGQVLINIGNTSIMVQIFSSLTSPSKDRPSEGNIVFTVDTNHLKHSADSNNSSEILSTMRNTITTLLEKSLRDSKALDAQSLCIVPHQLVWKIVVNINVLNNEGNVYDAVMIGALASWMNYKIQFLRKKNNTVDISIKESTKFVNLSILHIPVCIMTGIYKEMIIVDPDLNEEKVIDGFMLVSANRFSEICYLHTYNAAKINKNQLEDILIMSKKKVKEILNILSEFKSKMQSNTGYICQDIVRMDLDHDLNEYSKEKNEIYQNSNNNSNNNMQQEEEGYNIYKLN